MANLSCDDICRTITNGGVLLDVRSANEFMQMSLTVARYQTQKTYP